MNKNKKIDIVKIKAIVGLIIFISTIVILKIMDIYLFFENYRLEAISILSISNIVSLFLMAPYNRRI
jgi:hypothetical protein